MYAVIHKSNGRLGVALANSNQESLFTHTDRGTCVREASWMNLVLDMSRNIEDTDITATSPITGNDFTVSGPISSEQVSHVRELVSNS